MTAFDAAAGSTDQGRHEPVPAGSGSLSRPIPTPGDLWPREVRQGSGDEGELATGTG